MAKIVKITNQAHRDLTILGRLILDGETILLSPSEIETWRGSEEAFDSVADKDILISDDKIVYTNPMQGWNYLYGEELPISEVGNKIWVHSSAKPIIPGKTLYVQWIGRGDDIQNHVLGQGDLLHFNITPGTPNLYKDIKFDPLFGSVYVHEGYASWHNAGLGDTMSALIMAEPTPLQQVANLDLIVDENGNIHYSPQGPGTGTHGFAGLPHLLSRSYSQDGEWDYDETNGLRPNFTNTGLFRMSTYEQAVHRFVNDVPIYGTSDDFFRMVSEDTFLLPPGYFMRIFVNNNSNTEWHAAVMMTVYRERTFQP
ncbi:MAG: hypothetical protein QXN55_01465 [Candidatus Nitrosotenuis sp.]